MQNPDFPASLPFDDHARACVLLREVCSLASIGMRLSGPDAACDARGDSAETGLRDRLQLLHQTLGRIGWVADTALRTLGDPGTFADAEDWMLADL